MKCQCNIESKDHAAGQCQDSSDLRLYRRQGEVLALCFNCAMAGDMLLDPTLADEVKVLARALAIDQPPEYFDRLTESTLGYLLVSMQHTERERARAHSAQLELDFEGKE